MNRSGMTLVELIAGIVVAGLVLSTAYAAYSTVSAIGTRAGVESSRIVSQAAKRATLERWLATAEPDTLPSAWRVRTGAASRTSEVVLTTSQFRAGSSAKVYLTLSVDNDPATAESGLVATITQAGSAERRLEIERSVHALKASVLIQSAGVRAWVDNSLEHPEIPEAVRVQLMGDDVPDLLSIPIMAVRMR